MLLTIEEIEQTLRDTLPGVPETDIHRSAVAIMERGGMWREVDLREHPLGSEFSIQCRDICAIGESVDKGLRVRAFVAQPE